MSELKSASLSPQQTDILRTFRGQLFSEGILREGDSIGTDDETLLRFLRARKFNLNESKKMFKNCQHWRKTVSGVGIDELNNRMDPFDYPGREEVFKSWSMFFHKTDKIGRPVNIQFMGSINLQELYQHVTPEKLMESIVVGADSLTHEVLPAASRAAGRHIGQYLSIVDIEGFGLSQFWEVKSVVQASFHLAQEYYPETMGRIVVVNAPSSFTFIWSIIKRWLAKETAEKVDIVGKNYKEVLLQLVDADNLPTTLGGNCTCSGEGGCDMSSAGPWMDERLAKKVAMKEDDQPNGLSESSTPTLIPSEPMDAVREKVVPVDTTAETSIAILPEAA